MSPRLRGVFVVGTDTGVGKTFVSRALCRALRLHHRPVVGLKPYESGCDPWPLDAEALEREARSGVPLALRCPFRYRAAIAPAVAAEREGRIDRLTRAVAIAREAARGKFAVVESAGGLASPVDRSRTNLDLAVALGLPVLLVGRDALGTLSQISLAADALKRRRVRVLGLILSRGTAAADPSQASNLEWAQRLTGLRQALILPRTSIARAADRLAPLLSLASEAR